MPWWTNIRRHWAPAANALSIFMCGISLIRCSKFLQTSIAVVQEVVDDPDALPDNYSKMISSISDMNDIQLTMKTDGIMNIINSLAIFAYIVGNLIPT